MRKLKISFSIGEEQAGSVLADLADRVSELAFAVETEPDREFIRAVASAAQDAKLPAKKFTYRKYPAKPWKIFEQEFLALPKGEFRATLLGQNATRAGAKNVGSLYAFLNRQTVANLLTKTGKGRYIKN